MCYVYDHFKSNQTLTVLLYVVKKAMYDKMLCFASIVLISYTNKTLSFLYELHFPCLSDSAK